MVKARQLSYAQWGKHPDILYKAVDKESKEVKGPSVEKRTLEVIQNPTSNRSENFSFLS